MFCVGATWSANETTPLKSLNGEKETYIGSYSSNCEIKTGDRVSLLKTGEAVFIKEKLDIETVLAEFGGEIVFVEETEEAVNYYAFSRTFKNCKTINGKTINLHISVSKNGTKLGTPVIFGSF